MFLKTFKTNLFSNWQKSILNANFSLHQLFSQMEKISGEVDYRNSEDQEVQSHKVHNSSPLKVPHKTNSGTSPSFITPLGEMARWFNGDKQINLTTWQARGKSFWKFNGIFNVLNVSNFNNSCWLFDLHYYSQYSKLLISSQYLLEHFLFWLNIKYFVYQFWEEFILLMGHGWNDKKTWER